MTKDKKSKPEIDPRISFSERNIARWTGAFGIRTVGRDGRVERILERRDEKGIVVSRVRIGAVGYNKKLRMLSFEHKKMWNLIERLFDRQGRPADSWIEISSVAFYDFLFDITSMDNPSRRKNRDGIRYRDMVYDLLMVLTLTPWTFENWEIRNGDGVGVKRLNLVDEFEMYGRTDKGLFPDKGLFGKIRIKINPTVAEGLRQRNTTPILIEVQNSIKSPTAGILYGYLSQVLFKYPIFEIEVIDLAERLQIGTQGQIVRDMRRAAKEIEGLEFASGRIIECRIEKRGRDYYLVAKRSVNERREITVDIKEDRRKAEEQRLMDSRVEESIYLQRFEELPFEEKIVCEGEIADLLRDRVKNGFGFEMHRRLATVEVMEKYFTKKNNALIGQHCLREDAGPVYLGTGARAALGDLAATLREYAALRAATDPS